MGQDDWLNITPLPPKLPQFINCYKRKKLRFDKPQLPGACSIDKSPLMPHLCPTFPQERGMCGLHLLVHYHKENEVALYKISPLVYMYVVVQ